MRDKDTRANQRDGALDLVAILRSASDRPRRLELIRLCASLCLCASLWQANSTRE
ncbi:MAG: hypothetical protein JKY65_32520 [Planctomycetes bacterium]|nr:hypothetical protein [Planctomycetota bacterium]